LNILNSFSKNTQNFLRKSVHWEPTFSMRTDRQDEVNSVLRNFAKATKMELFFELCNIWSSQLKHSLVPWVTTALQLILLPVFSSQRLARHKVHTIHLLFKILRVHSFRRICLQLVP